MFNKNIYCLDKWGDTLIDYFKWRLMTDRDCVTQTGGRGGREVARETQSI